MVAINNPGRVTAGTSADTAAIALMSRVLKLQAMGLSEEAILQQVGEELERLPQSALLKAAQTLNVQTEPEPMRRAMLNHQAAIDRTGAPPPSRSVFLQAPPSPNGSIDTTDEVMVCAVCNITLNHFIDLDGDDVYLHSASWETYDHDPVPKAVPRGDYSNQPCDFCGKRGQIMWRFFGDRMAHDDGGMVTDLGEAWGGCDVCSARIQEGDLEGLLEQWNRVSPAAKSGDPEIDQIMRGKTLNLWITFIHTIYRQTYVGPKREPAKLNPRMMPKLQRGLLKMWRHPGFLGLLNSNWKSNGQTHSIPGVHCGDEDTFSKQFPPHVHIPEQYWHNFIDHICAGIEGGDLYWISENFTQLAIMAGKDFDKLAITREELPSTFGFMVYATPIGQIERPDGPAGIRGISWTLVPRGIWLNIYFQGEDGDPEVDIETMRSEIGYLMSPNAGGGFEFGQELDIPADEPNFQFVRTIFATWFLMVQPGVADRESAPVDKKYARSYQRSYGRQLPDVVLVDLRKRPHRPGGEVSREGHKLTVRVYRKGHWKRQFYGPKRALRKTIYVNGYIAGPEGAPLKERPTEVKVLR